MGILGLVFLPLPSFSFPFFPNRHSCGAHHVRGSARISPWTRESALSYANSEVTSAARSKKGSGTLRPALPPPRLPPSRSLSLSLSVRPNSHTQAHHAYLSGAKPPPPLHAGFYSRVRLTRLFFFSSKGFPAIFIFIYFFFFLGCLISSILYSELLKRHSKGRRILLLLVFGRRLERFKPNSKKRDGIMCNEDTRNQIETRPVFVLKHHQLSLTFRVKQNETPSQSESPNHSILILFNFISFYLILL